MNKFLFQISNDFINGATFLKPAYSEVNYSVDNREVKVWDVKIPFYLLAYINTSGHFMTQIQAAAENNAMSEGLIESTPVVKVIIHDSIAV